ncbi:MAG: hypothetical protein GF409_07840 [Candidatus Omnitrophica bacterium]|nr:hypothetical protein [Candidatus Omnitrophota bacterium]
MFLKKEDGMNPFDFAMQLEKEGEKYYRELAEKTDNEGCRNIFNMLADDEVKHFNVFKGMKEGKTEDFPATQVMEEARKTFQSFAEKGNPFEEEMSQKELYGKALEVEEKTRDFYLEKSEETEDSREKELFRKIADEEQMHYNLIDELLGFIKEPETFLENAEFFNSDDYWMMRR